MLLFNIWDLVIIGSIILDVFTCPFSKVEESFNMQAMHDLLIHGTNLDNYDHFEFPGVVPRTFIGALAVSFFSFPFHWIFRFLGLSKLSSLYLVRSVIGIFSALCFIAFRHSVIQKFGKQVGISLSIIMLTQFHLIFYMSRSLPNIFALMLGISHLKLPNTIVMLAYSFWLQEKITPSIALFTFTIIVFRSEVAVLFAPILLEFLLNKRITFFKMILLGIICTSFSLVASITLDSIFWRRLIWPEGVVFWYNTYENKSHNWGVMPFYWYFVNAIPRAMLYSLLLVPISLYYERRVRNFILPILTFVFMYSFLPHKEIRFIFYVFPILNLGAAVGLVRIYNNQSKNFLFKLFFYISVLGLLASALVSAFSLQVSSHNYPSGYALKKLHEISLNETNPYVHIDTYCAMNGISRFSEQYEGWKYSKLENTTDFSPYTHLVTETPSIEGFEVIHIQEGFDRILFKYQFPFIKLSPKVYVMKKIKK